MESSLFLALPDDIIHQILRKVASQRPLSLFSSLFACKGLYRFRSFSTVWRDAFFGFGLKAQDLDTAQVKAIETIVAESESGYMKLVAASLAKRRNTNGRKSKTKVSFSSVKVIAVVRAEKTGVVLCGPCESNYSGSISCNERAFSLQGILREVYTPQVQARRLTYSITSGLTLCSPEVTFPSGRTKFAVEIYFLMTGTEKVAGLFGRSDFQSMRRQRDGSRLYWSSFDPPPSENFFLPLRIKRAEVLSFWPEVKLLGAGRPESSTNALKEGRQWRFEFEYQQHGVALLKGPRIYVNCSQFENAVLRHLEWK